VAGERRVRLILLSLIAGLVLAAPARAEHVVETADLGTVHAEFSFDRTVEEFPAYSNLALWVTDGGVKTVSATYPEGYQPGGFDRPSLRAADLDGDGAPEVQVDIFSGGAHCCLQSRVYDGRRAFKRDWRDAGYELVDRAGQTYYRSADDYFAYAYGAYAYSRLPLQVVRYTGSGFEVVTRDAVWAPDLRAERARLLREYTRARRHPNRIEDQQLTRATLAAAAADDCSLGDCARGIARIRGAARRGEIRRYGSGKHSPGTSFLRDVRRDLERAGYA
jgi:hypothetical protein